MKAKINGIYLRVMRSKLRSVRVLDFVTMENGERGVVFVNTEATDEQIQSHSIRFDVLPETEFFKTYSPVELSDGDEINVFDGINHVGTFTVTKTEDEKVFKCEALDGILFDSRVAIGGGLTPIYTPASQKERFFSIITSEATNKETAKIISAMIEDAQHFIDCLKTYPVVAYVDLEKLRECEKYQTAKLTKIAAHLRDTIPTCLAEICGK